MYVVMTVCVLGGGGGGGRYLFLFGDRQETGLEHENKNIRISVWLCECVCVICEGGVNKKHAMILRLDSNISNKEENIIKFKYIRAHQNFSKN